MFHKKLQIRHNTKTISVTPIRVPPKQFWIYMKLCFRGGILETYFYFYPFLFPILFKILNKYNIFVLDFWVGTRSFEVIHFEVLYSLSHFGFFTIMLEQLRYGTRIAFGGSGIYRR